MGGWGDGLGSQVKVRHWVMRVRKVLSKSLVPVVPSRVQCGKTFGLLFKKN